MGKSKNLKRYVVELSNDDLKDVVAKLANELEVYGEDASKGLINGFVKFYKLLSYDAIKNQSTLMEKWSGVYL